MSTIGQTPSPASQPAEAGNGKDAGRASDFGGALWEAAVAAVREQTAKQAEGHVATALSLGWYLAALGHSGEILRTAAAARGDLTEAAGKGDAGALAFCRQHVEVAFAKLKAVIEEAVPDASRLDELRTCLDSAEADARRDAAVELDGKLLAILSAADFRLSRAYAVGRGLLNLTSRPKPDEKLVNHLTAPRVAALAADIDDLSSALPAHAGHSVRDSLLEWRRSIAERSEVAPENAETWLLLARQGELWRLMLTGEKSGLDMLEINDYLDAAGRLASRMRTIARRLVLKVPELAAAVVLLFAIGVALIALTDSEAAIVAGAGTVLASLGLSWRGIGKSLGGLVGKVERPLWGAELDKAITPAITLLRREKARDATKARREVAVALERDFIR